MIRFCSKLKQKIDNAGICSTCNYYKKNSNVSVPDIETCDNKEKILPEIKYLSCLYKKIKNKSESYNRKVFNIHSLSKDIKFYISNLQSKSVTVIEKIVIKWEKFAGGYFSSNTIPYSIKNNILYVKTKNPSISQSLIFMKQELINKINKDFGEDTIKDIKPLQTTFKRMTIK